MDGDYKREYASKGVAGAGLGLGIAGTALGLLQGGAGILGNGCNRNMMPWDTGCCSENTPVTRYELNMALDSAAKDSKIALLEANIFTDGKIADLADRTVARFTGVEAQLREIAVYQGVNTATIQCLQGQVNQLAALTKLVVPSTNVCQQDAQVVVANTACNPVLTKVVTTPSAG